MNRLRYFLYFRGIVLTTDRMLTLDKIYQASYALKTVIRRTDLISAPNINPESHIFLKPENLQVTGSLKCAALVSRSPSLRKKRNRMA